MILSRKVRKPYTCFSQYVVFDLVSSSSNGDWSFLTYANLYLRIMRSLAPVIAVFKSKVVHSIHEPFKETKTFLVLSSNMHYLNAHLQPTGFSSVCFCYGNSNCLS